MSDQPAREVKWVGWQYEDNTPQLRFQAACHAMQGLLARENSMTPWSPQAIVERSIALADALLAELNKGREA